MPSRLKELRIARGHTMESLAELIGTKKETVYKLEKGERSMDEHWIHKITAELNVTSDELLGLAEPVADWKEFATNRPRKVAKLKPEDVAAVVYSCIRDNALNPPKTEEEILDLHRKCLEFCASKLG